MDDFTAYRLFLAIKLHFTQKKYDVFVNRGAIRGLNRETFAKKREAKWFRNISKQFKNPKDFVQACVAQVVYGSINDIYDLDTFNTNYQLWSKNKQRLTYLIKEDLSTIDVPDIISGKPPKILKSTIGGKIHLETAVAINRHFSFITDEFLKKDYLLFADEALKIKKLDRFVKYDTDAIGKILDSINILSVGGGGFNTINMESPSD